MTRAEIARWIVDNTSRRGYNGDFYPFCFDVKVYSVDFGFDHLLTLFRANYPDSKFTRNPNWLRKVRRRFESLDPDALWSAALERAQFHFFDTSRSRYGLPGTDAYAQLPNGKAIDVRFDFVGRSGGWLSLSYFQGYQFASRTPFRWGDYMAGTSHNPHEAPMPMQVLRELHQFVRWLKLSLTPDKIRNELEYQASQVFFEGHCAGIRRDEWYQPSLFPDLEESIS